MTKYTHEEIEYMIESERRLGSNSIKVIRQLLEEYEALDVKRAYFENLAQQQGKRVEQLEAELKTKEFTPEEIETIKRCVKDYKEGRFKSLDENLHLFD